MSAHRRGSRYWAPTDPRSTAWGNRPGSPLPGQAESQELPLRHARSTRASRGTGNDPIQRLPVTWDRDERMRHKDAPGENKKRNKKPNQAKPQILDPSSPGCRTAPPRRRASTGIGKSLPGRARRGSRWCLWEPVSAPGRLQHRPALRPHARRALARPHRHGTAPDPR